MKKNFSLIFIILIIIISIVIIISVLSIFEIKNYKIVRYKITNEKNKSPLKLVYISDFHNKPDTMYNENVINDIIKEKPDYIILGGDFVDFSTFDKMSKKTGYKYTLDFLSDLNKKVKDNLGYANNNINRIFFTFGNHELRLKNMNSNQELTDKYKYIIDSINKLGINIIYNTMVTLNDNYTISSLDLYEGYYTNLFDKATKFNIETSILDEYFFDIDKNKYNIMAFHKPDYCEDFFKYGFDLVLSGHNHGGLIRFPVIGSAISPDLKIMPKYSHGQYNVDGKTLILSSGIGEHFPKIRVNNNPEIVVVSIN